MNVARSRFQERANKKRQKEFGPIKRLNFLLGLFLLFATLIVLRLFNVQVLQHSFYTALASGQHELYQQLFPERGEIYAQDKFSQDGLYKIVVNKEMHLLYAVPKQIDDPEDVTKRLLPYVDLDQQTLLDRLSKEDDQYEPIQHKVSDFEKGEIEKLELPGLHFTAEDWRHYPEENYTSHLTGFVGYVGDERRGQYGLEGYFEEELAGSAGFLKSEKDAAGRLIAIGQRLIEEAVDGDDLVLTVDRNIQYYACNQLRKAVLRHGANKGAVIILNPKTGAIIALCSYPDFDPNNYEDTEDVEAFKNVAVFDQYEPGSVFKIFTMAAGLDMNLISPQSTYTDTGQVQIGSYTIKNSDEKAYGVQTMVDVLRESLNTGSIYIVQQVGNNNFYRYLANFGFGEKTGITLSGENMGDISSLSNDKDIYSATASFGQGITVTPLQLAMAAAAIANQGTLVKPYIVEKTIKPDGTVIETEPVEIRQVMSPPAAAALGAMMVKVIDEGHATRAGVTGYYLAGKTGTAQVIKENGAGYDEYRHNDTFVGYGPLVDPQFVILTKIDEPKDVEWAAGSAAPLFGDIAKFVIDYYQIPPDRK